MAWLPMYLLREDITSLNNWLNEEDEIAFIVAVDKKKWKAVKNRNIENDLGSQTMGFFNQKIPNYVEYCLWHIPSGSLPLVPPNTDGVSLRLKKEDWVIKEKIVDPWKEWTEIRSGANPNLPYFESHPGILHLRINVPINSNFITISDFGWIGNHYSILGSHADSSTLKFWNKLRRAIRKMTTHIPRGNDNSYKKEIYAFPNAYQEISNGRPCSIN